jgi:hypothetical protein
MSSPAKRRWTWLVLTLAVVVALFITHQIWQRGQAQAVADVVHAIPEQVKRLDQEFSEKMKATFRPETGAVISGPAIADPAARKEARANLAATLKLIDDTLARRERIAQDAIAAINATGAPKALKSRVTAELQASAAAPPLAAQMMKGLRAFLAKGDELVAHADAAAATIVIQEGKTYYADPRTAAKERELRQELAALELENRKLVEEARGKK